jgi:FixJ family two-component response regulator
MDASPPKVFLIDDDDSARESLEFLLTSKGFSVSSFPSAVHWLSAFKQTSVACVVADICMPGIDGPELQRIMLDRDIDVPIVFISGCADVNLATTTLRNGAIDLLEKPIDGDLLADRIRDGFMISRKNLAANQERIRINELLVSLTEKEREVLPLVYSGKSLKQIAAHFDVTVPTASRHQSRAFDKLGIESVAQLIRMLDAAGVNPESSE